MAQRTGAERFLAPLAGSAGAGVTLALALAALALAGCGGGSSEQGQESASQASTATAAGQGAQGSAGAGQSAPAAEKSPGAGPGDSASNASAGAGAQGGGGGATQKHGRHVPQPKGPQEQAPSPSDLANATVADITLKSPAIVAANGQPGSLAPTYTCDGEDSWPAFSWSGVPAGTAELALYAMNVQPVKEKLFVDWAVAGIDPALAGIEAGELPKGAITATNSFGERGYSLCPQGQGEIYMFALYALPTRLGLRPGFDAREARAQILAVSGNVGLLPALYAHS